MGKKSKNNKGGEDGWQDVKPGKKTAKPSANAGGNSNNNNSNNNASSGDSQVQTSGPLKTVPTMYQQAEDLAQQKAERRSGKSTAKSAPKDASATASNKFAKSQAKKKSKLKGKAARPSGIKERVEALNTDGLLAVVTKAKDTFPGKEDQWMRSLAGEIIFKLQGSMGKESPDAPLCYASAEVKSTLIKMFSASKPKLLAHFFAEFVKQLVDIGLQGQVNDKPGLQFLIQLFVRIEVKLNIDITLASLQPLFKHFRERFPEDKVTIPMVWSISQTAAINPAVFLFAWKYLMLSVLMDKASPAVKDICVAYLRTALFRGGTAGESLKEILSHRLFQPRGNAPPAQLLTPPELAKLMKLVFTNTASLTPDQRTKLLAAYPFFREVSLRQSAYTQFNHQFQYAAIPVAEQTWLTQVLLYLNICMARDPRCFDVLIRQQKAGEVNRVMRILHFGVRSCQRGSDSPFVRHPREFSNTAAALKQVNKSFRNGKLETPKPPAKLRKESKKGKKQAEEEEAAAPSWLEMNKGLLDQSDLVCDSVKDVLHQSSDSLLPLWIALLISFGLFLFLGSHLYCRYHTNSKDVFLADQCASMEESGLLDGVDSLYEGLSPYVNAVTPYFVQAREAVKPYWDVVAEAVGPHLHTARETVTPYAQQASDTIGPLVEKAYETVQPHVSSAYEAVHPHVTKAVDAAAPYLTSAKEAAAPYVAKSSDFLSDLAESAGPYFQDLSDAAVEYFEKAKEFVNEQIQNYSGSSSAPAPTASAAA